MISKELLSEVLFDGRVEVKWFGVNGNTLDYSLFCSLNQLKGTDYNKDIPNNYYTTEQNIYENINIYELSHKCKEWAHREYDAIIYSAVCNGCQSARLHFRGRAFGGLQNGEVKEFNYGLEYISIIKACEWILEEKENEY